MKEDKFDEIAAFIAAKHHTSVRRDDPILIAHTILELALAEARAEQSTLLKQFHEEIEKISSDWSSDAKKRAEDILSAALHHSKESIKADAIVIYETISDNISKHIDNEMKQHTDTLAELAKETKRTGYINMAASAVLSISILISALIILN